MKSCHREMIDLANKVLAGRGKVAYVAGKKHPHLVITLQNGRAFKNYFSGSPSDYRAMLNQKSQIRRLVETALGDHKTFAR
jgi:hypothetical protein